MYLCLYSSLYSQLELLKQSQFMLTLLHAPYHNLINSSILLLIRHKSAQVTQPRDTTLHQETIETGQETLLRHQETDRPRDLTPSSGDRQAKRPYSVIRRQTGQETLLRHQETACVQGEPQAKRHYSVIRRRPVSSESHRPRDITPSSGDGLCPGRATGQETLLRHQETACVQGEPQAKRHYSVIRRWYSLCPGRATGQETLLRHQETACVQ